jgi:hypothetical protein
MKINMSLDKFIMKIIEDGIKDGKENYNKEKQITLKEDLMGLEGSKDGCIAGFQSCSNKDANEISNLLKFAHENTSRISNTPEDQKINGNVTFYEYCYVSGFEAAVKWVAGCISALFIISGLPQITTPTKQESKKTKFIIHNYFKEK